MVNEKKVLVITGGSGGIGKKTIDLFIKNQFDVAFTFYRDKSEARKISKKYKSARVVGYPCDITKIKDCKRTIKCIIRDFGRIDVLVNNAGGWIPKLFELSDSKNWDSILNQNLTGHFNFIKSAFPILKKQKRGKIVNVASIAGITGSLLSPPYSAAKGGIIAFSYTIARDFAKYHINVNCVAPGPTRTNMLTKNVSKKFIKKITSETPLGRIALPEDIAKAIWFFSSDLSDFITGQTLIVDGGRLMR